MDKKLQSTIFIAVIFFIGVTLYSVVLKKENESWDGLEGKMPEDWNINLNSEPWQAELDNKNLNFINEQEDHRTFHPTEEAGNRGTNTQEAPDNFLKIEKKEAYVPEKTSTPKHWKGLPISEGNDLYKEPSEAMNIKKIDLKIEIEKNKSFTKGEVDKIISEYAGTIGWNGILDIFDEHYENNLTTTEQQSNLGSYYHLGLRAMERTKHYRYAVEVTSRGQLNKSPLRAVIFEAITNNLNVDFVHKARQLIDTELCYFKYSPKMGEQYISCLEGVGQGVGFIIQENFDEATLVCDALFDDVDDKYSCTAGLFMGVIPQYPDDSYSPCDVALRFPAACFKLKRKTFTMLRKLTNPCRTINSDYHYRACIFGEAYLAVITNASHPMGNARHYCRKYELNNKRETYLHDFATCVEGFYSTHRINQYPKDVIPYECDGFENTTEIESICYRHASIPLDGITFTDPPSYQKYPWELLEEVYNQTLDPVPATWPQILVNKGEDYL